MSGIEKIDKSTLPKHVAIVMDGNGRWAKSRGKDRIFGHSEGINSVRAVVEAARELGLSYLTLYVFSTENWNRPKKEVNALMRLMMETIDRETGDLIKNSVRGLVVGDLDRLDKDIQNKIQQFMHNTAQGKELNLVLALSYSSRWEIIEAVKGIAKALSEGRILEQELDEDHFSKYLCTVGIPDPDLLIRTGGEIRISNFMLWQAAYAELYFTETAWPEFRKEAFYKAIIEYQSRERRFGKTSEQLTNKRP